MLFIKILYKNGDAISPFLINAPVDGECSLDYFNRFTCNFTNFCFDNIPECQLIQMFRDGRYISPLLELWLDQNTNLIYIRGDKGHDFVDDNNKRYQLKTFTKNGMNFRPSAQIGGGRSQNSKKFEIYCKTQVFIIADVTKFPVVNFKIIKGEDLLKLFPGGKVTFKKLNVLFPSV